MTLRAFSRVPFLRSERLPGAPITATRALAAAFHDTMDLLLQPLDAGRWLKLSILCLFLGGGTPSAAFNWSLGSLPGDIGFADAMGRARAVIAEHVWLIALVALLGIALLFATLYFRCAFRFVLVDAILKREVRIRPILKETRSIGRSYFRWLIIAVGGLTLVLLGGGVLAYPYLRSAAAAGLRSPAFWAMLAGVLLVDVLIGLAVALAVVLTDDFVAPIMYAERLPLIAAWRKLGPKLKAEAGPFAAYVLVRFAVALAASIATLVLLFPMLLGLFSGAILTCAVTVLTLRLLGVLWSWNPLTLSLTGAGLSVLIGLVLVVLSVVGMPAQVLIQSFGIRFIASRFPTVEAEMLRQPETAIEGGAGAGTYVGN